MSAKYVFGPIASRRLGLSLGVDLVTRKTCTQDCPYCEAGWTTNLTLERKEYVPAAAVKAELRSVLDSGPEIDFITFSGAGEPTLNSKIGEIVDFIKDEYTQYSLCLLTNGSLLDDPEVAAEVSRVDLIIPNLDASSEEEFKKINAPAPGLTFNRFFSGFLNGKILDSAIIGVLCFILTVLLRIDFAVLISVVIGVTNIIPFFGPIVGAIPCIFILLIVDPWQALRFSILVLGLQQFDGNILGPKILGDSTGISAFWVLVSIVIGGGLFGFPGMLLGVPTFAVLYSLLGDWVRSRLKAKGIRAPEGEAPACPDESDKRE